VRLAKLKAEQDQAAKDADLRRKQELENERLDKDKAL